jgi:hypothetical protein
MPATTGTRRRAAAKTAPEPEIVEDEFEEDDTEDMEDDTEDGDDLEELEDAEEPETKPAKAKRTPPVRPTIEFGSPWLAAYITEHTSETYDARGIRMLLRKLAKDGAFEREVGTDKTRYEFSGPKDPIVVAVLAMVKSGAAKELKQAGLQAVKDKAAQKKAAAAKAKPKVAPVEEDEDDMEEVEEAPKPRRRTAAKATTAPAKAAPAARRRTAAK